MIFTILTYIWITNMILIFAAGELCFGFFTDAEFFSFTGEYEARVRLAKIRKTLKYTFKRRSVKSWLIYYRKNKKTLKANIYELQSSFLLL